MKCSCNCPFCDTDSIFLINAYDAKSCLFCDQWLEKVCHDPECPFCAIRPDTPSSALFLLKEKAEYRTQQFRKDWLRLHYQHQYNGKICHERKRKLLQEIKL